MAILGHCMTLNLDNKENFERSVENSKLHFEELLIKY